MNTTNIQTTAVSSAPKRIILASAYRHEQHSTGRQERARVPVDLHVYSTPKELLVSLAEQVERWTSEAGIAPDDIALLTPKSAERSVLWTVDRLGRFRLTDDPWEKGKLFSLVDLPVQGA